MTEFLSSDSWGSRTVKLELGKKGIVKDPQVRIIVEAGSVSGGTIKLHQRVDICNFWDAVVDIMVELKEELESVEVEASLSRRFAEVDGVFEGRKAWVERERSSS